MPNEIDSLILGQKLGRGAYRDVYVFAPDPTKVIKVANCDEGRSANLIEDKLWWEIWQTPVAKWFAPVYSVSTAGEYLLQQRVEPLPREQYPDKIPAFFTDTKYSNFGHIKDKGFVCCDYGSFNIFKGVATRMKKADWWE